MLKIFLKGTYKIITFTFTIAFLLQNFSPRKDIPIDELLIASSTMCIILIYGIGNITGSIYKTLK